MTRASYLPALLLLLAAEGTMGCGGSSEPVSSSGGSGGSAAEGASGGSSSGGTGGNTGSGANGGGLEKPNPFETATWTSAPIQGEHTRSSAACGSDTTVIGGGCDCGEEGNITVTMMGAENDWICACDSPAEGAQAYALCSEHAIEFNVVETSFDGTGLAAIATCPAGQIANFGGVECGEENSFVVTASNYFGVNAWHGECAAEGTNARSYAYCLDSFFAPFYGETVEFTENHHVADCGGVELPQVGGGCECHYSQGLGANHPTDAGWRCGCNGVSEEEPGQHTAFCLGPVY